MQTLAALSVAPAAGAAKADDADSDALSGLEALGDTLQRDIGGVAAAVESLGQTVRKGLQGRLDSIDQKLARMQQQLNRNATNEEPDSPRLQSPVSRMPARQGSSESVLAVQDGIGSTGDIIDDTSSRRPSNATSQVFVPCAAWLIEEENVANLIDAAAFEAFAHAPPKARMVKDPPHKRYRGWIQRPSSSTRLSWDFFGLMLITWDTLFIPVQLSFEPPEVPFTTFMFWLALLYWTGDILYSFLTGFYVKGVEELNPKRIAIRYLTTWFTLDIMLVASDWWVVAASAGRNGTSLARAGKTLRILRILRSLRLLRLAKISKLLGILQDQITSQYIHILIYMLKLALFIVWLNHVIACGFYALSINLRDIYEKTWVQEALLPGIDANELYLYLTAMHWSLTQFTPASMEIVARNSPERAYTVAVLFFALMVFSSFLSSITGAMTQLRQLSSVFDQNVSLLRRYLQKREISHDLSVRILKYVEHQLTNQYDEIQQKDVRLLEVLSDPLRQELVQENICPILTPHPFFKAFAQTDSGAMNQLCNFAVKQSSLMEGDTVFCEGVTDDHMYVLLQNSRLSYEFQQKRRATQRGRSFIVDTHGHDRSEHDKTPLEDWCCEAALWTKWVHLGSMRALDVSNVLSIKGEIIQKIALSHHLVHAGTAKYAQAWVERLNRQAIEAAAAGKPLTDVPSIVNNAEAELEELEELAYTAFDLEALEQAFRRQATEHQLRSDMVLEDQASTAESVESSAHAGNGEERPIANGDHSANASKSSGSSKVTQSALSPHGAASAPSGAPVPMSL
mmetsp:Transcript_41426/g.107206  ORF Transcript_41426/g.107206 Transcript_41426/m.107206 type:complete len:796 (-) Transcript_41426:238-2625(-)